MSDDPKVRFSEDTKDEDRPSRSRSASPSRTAVGEPPKEKKFLQGWTPEQERLMAEWSDLAMCYRWLHDRAEKHFHKRNLWITLPVIILTTLGGTANFGIQSLFSDDASKQRASFVIGGISLVAGMLTTVGNYLRYAQSEESNRVASIAWGKFQRLIAVELALKPDDRMDALDFMKVCRADLDRLIEQSPPIPDPVIHMFTTEFKDLDSIKKPEICGSLEHTRVFESKDMRLKQAAMEAALMLKHKRNALSEFMTPKIQEAIKAQVDAKLQEAIEQRTQTLQEEIERKKEEAKRVEEEYHKALAERQKAIQDEIEAEKARILKPAAPHVPTLTPVVPPTKYRPTFQDRLQFKSNPLFRGSFVSPSPSAAVSAAASAVTSPALVSTPTAQGVDALSLDAPVQVVVIPSAAESEQKV
jgi:hypothetical protein